MAVAAITAAAAVIRPADPARDAAAIAAIYAPHVTHGTASFEEIAPDTAEIARRVATISARHPWLVAERRGEIAGYAYGSPFNERAAYRWAANVTVYVHPDHARAGVARGLYTALFTLLKRQGFWTLGAGITADNVPSIALHEAFGFHRVALYPTVGFKADRWVDVGWWMLSLRTPAHGAEVPPEPLSPAALQAWPEFTAALAAGAALIRS